MIGSCELKARVEESLGTVLDPDFFGQAEQYARRKLDMCNERAGRIYGEDGYGDEYLVLLTADTVREMAFSAWCEIRNTASGAVAEQGVTISADWDVLPPGTIVYIDGLGERVVQDRGGAIKGNAVDIYFEDHDEALVFGRQAVRLYIIEERREQS